MPVHMSWQDVALRLALSVVAGGLIGFNRSEHGRPAGLRTTILVCLAATVAMIQANMMLELSGRKPDSFIMLDLMRLPLGILSGIGFIGAGAILRNGDMVTGVTTAATLWFVTVMGLCFGAGQLELGLAVLALGMFVLVVLKWFEDRIGAEHHALLVLSCQSSSFDEQDLRAVLRSAGFKIISCGVTYSVAADRRKLQCRVAWYGRLIDSQTPPILGQLAQRPGVLKVDWQP